MNKEKTKTNRINKKRLLLIIGIMVLSISTIVFIYLQKSEKAKNFVWYVDESFAAHWEKILAQAPKEFERFLQEGNIQIINSETAIPADTYGYIVTTNRLNALQLKNNQGNEQNSSSKEEVPAVIAYERLARSRVYKGAYVLALDPWLIFSKRSTPPLSRERIIAPAQGTQDTLLLLPGRDKKAVNSWAARLLQESTSSFIQDKASWNEVKGDLFRSGVFQEGAISSNWNEVLFTLLGTRECWTYAPISRLRTQSDYRTSQIEAFIFPEPGDNFSLQADILWLIPFGINDSNKQTKNLFNWLDSMEAGSVIAASTTWIPAHPDCPPYNPAAQTARIAWLTSSYVWELTEQ
ncbi:MAG: hypothetical protein LBN21_13590 [Treponema sp.]|nr:hypothetical protein [Treponema sp.]